MSQSVHTLHIETLTPVHVGSGRNLRGNFDYAIFDNSQIALLDERKIFDFIGREQLPTWLAMIEKGEDIVPYLRQRKPNLQAADIARRVAALPGKAPGLQSELREQITLGAAQQPCIPGTSFKGAIKTAVLASLIRKDPAFVKKEDNLKVTEKHKKVVKDEQVLAHYFNQKDHYNRDNELEPSPNEDVFRFLRISDAHFTTTNVIPALMYNMILAKGWQPDENRSPFVECLPAGQTTTARLQMPQDHIQLVEQKGYMKKNLRYVQDLPYLLQTINKHTAHLLQSEIDFWKEETLDYTPLDEYVEQLGTLLQQVQNVGSNACILRLGYASGWDSMTGRWAKDKDAFGDYILENDAWYMITAASRPGDSKYSDNTPFPKTRKTAAGMGPMGFVKLKV